MAIELRVLGCFRLRVDERDVDVSPVPARILAYLAVHGGGVRRSALARVLWPTAARERALGNLRSGLWRLPGEARPMVLESGPCLRLVDEVHCDLGANHDCAVTGSAALPDVLDWAWRGELLSGWYDDWVLAARESLQARRADQLEVLAAASRAVGNSGDALVYATLAVSAQPLRETAHRALLRAHLDLGHQTEAITLFDELARMLRHEIGIGPSVETAELVAAAREPAA
jgi:DNA-binding SARP family transcriptional activator